VWFRRESVCFREREKGNPFMEKLAFALIMTARKLRPYFQAHIVIVLTNHPLRKAMNKPDAAGRLIQWSVELSKFDIDYRSRSAIKAQALADFIVEFTNKDDEPVETEENKAPRWTVHTDGSSTKNAGRVRIIIRSPEGDVIKRAIRLQYTTTNNKAEYEALLAGLKTAKTLGAIEFNVHSDSQLVVGQVNGDYEVKEGRMLQYLNLVRHQMSRFHEVKLTRIPREQNTAADQLARSVSSSEPNEELEVVRHSSLQTIEVNPVETKTSWMTPIISYLERGTLPDNRHDARRIKVRASRFTILQGTLYKKGFSLPYLRCLTPAEAEYVLREIHEGICGNHSGTQSLAKKVVRAGYYWPSIQADADLLVRHYDKCQRFANLHHSPSEELTPMTSPWPFAQWGLDIMGPLPIGRHQLRFVVVAIDYFTKWVEAEPLATITERNIQNFV
jgi:ribonuclease HI